MASGDVKRILEIGCKGEDVKTIQTVLNIKVDGVYGHQTRLAVEDYQIKNMLEVDGKVTPKMSLMMYENIISACTDESLERLNEQNKKD